MASPVSSHLAAHLRHSQTTNAEGAPCWLDLGLCYGLGSPTAPLGQAQTTNAKKAPLLAGLRSLLQPGLPNLFKSKLQRGRRRLYQKLSVAVTNYIISVHAYKSYTINAVSGFTKKCLLVMYHKKYCEATMDDLLLFTPSNGAHMAKLKDLLKALLKNGLKIFLKKCQLFRTNLHYMGMRYSFRTKEFVSNL